MLGWGSLGPRWAPHQLSPHSSDSSLERGPGLSPSSEGRSTKNAMSKASGMRCAQDTSPPCTCLFLQPHGSQPPRPTPSWTCFQTQGGGGSLLKAELTRDVLGWGPLHSVLCVGLAPRLSPAPHLACP